MFNSENSKKLLKLLLEMVVTIEAHSSVLEDMLISYMVIKENGNKQEVEKKFSEQCEKKFAELSASRLKQFDDIY